MKSYLNFFFIRIKKYSNEKDLQRKLKKIVGLELREYSELQKNLRLKELKLFNREFGTSFYLKFAPIGESYNYKLTEILDKKNIEDKKIEKKEKKDQKVIQLKLLFD